MAIAPNFLINSCPRINTQLSELRPASIAILVREYQHTPPHRQNRLLRPRLHIVQKLESSFICLSKPRFCKVYLSITLGLAPVSSITNNVWSPTHTWILTTSSPGPTTRTGSRTVLRLLQGYLPPLCWSNPWPAVWLTLEADWSWTYKPALCLNRLSVLLLDIGQRSHKPALLRVTLTNGTSL